MAQNEHATYESCEDTVSNRNVRPAISVYAASWPMPKRPPPHLLTQANGDTCCSSQELARQNTPTRGPVASSSQRKLQRWQSVLVTSQLSSLFEELLSPSFALLPADTWTATAHAINTYCLWEGEIRRACLTLLDRTDPALPGMRGVSGRRRIVCGTAISVGLQRRVKTPICRDQR